MIKKYSLLCLLLAFSFLISVISCNLTVKKLEQKIEGYIILEVKMFADVNSSGFAEKPLSGNDSIQASTHRKMYIQNGYLIDVGENLRFNNGEYVKTDTLSFIFYDLVNQKYICFDKLSVDAKVIRSGRMTIDGSFSNNAKYDPMNGVVDSTWKLTDTIINGKRQGVINFSLTGITDSLDKELTKRAKFWVDYGTKNFPLQLSYILSKKLNGAFVYRMQNPFPDGKRIMLTTLDYQSAKLPDRLTTVFQRWTQMVREQ